MAELPKSKMSELSQKDISKKLDDKVALKNISDVLGNMIITTKQCGDKLRKKDKLKASQGLRMGGRAGYKSGSKGCKLSMKGKGRAYGKNS